MKKHLRTLLLFTALLIPWATKAQNTCIINSLPYLNDFESEPSYPGVSSYRINAFPNCWVRINDAISSENYFPYIATNNINVIHGNNSMLWRLQTYYAHANNQYAVLPPINQRISNLTLAFYAKTTATEAPYPMFIVGVMYQVTDTSTFVPVDTITLTSTVTLYTVDFADYTDSGKYIAIRCPRTSEERYASLDDIYLNRTDRWCNPVSNLRATATNSEVTVSWNSSGSGSYTVVLDTITVTGVTDTFYTFYGLTDTTIYHYAVAAECAGGSSPYLHGSILTRCHTLTYDDLPYTEDFESYGYGRDSAISPCWRKGMTDMVYLNYPYPALFQNRGDTVGLGCSSSTSYASWAALPRMDDSVDVRELEVEFLIGRVLNAQYLTRLVVGVASDLYTDSFNNLQLDNFVAVDTFDLSSEPIGSINPASVRFENYAGDGKYIVFLAPKLPDSLPSMTYNGFYLDNVTLKIASPCPTPQHVRVTRTAADSVFVTWDHLDNHDFAIIYIGTPGFSIDTASPQYWSDSSAAIGELRPDTEYELVIVALCDGVESYASYPVRFRTLCAYITTLPFVEGFEEVTGFSYPASNVNNLPPCWLYWNTGTEFSYQGFPIVFGSDAAYAHHSSNAMRFATTNQPGSYSDQIAIMPLTDPDEAPLSNLQVTFWMRTAHYYHNSYIVVGVMSDPTDTSTFVPVRTIYTNASTNYAHHTVGFANYSGPHGHVAFKAPMPATGSNQPMIDDIILDVIPNSCPEISAIHAQTTASAALLTWDYSIEFGTPLGFDVTYRYADDTTATPICTFTSEPEILLTDLGSDSLYWVSVSADCGGMIGTACTTHFRTQGVPCTQFDSIGAPGDTITLGNPGTAATQAVPLSSGNEYSYCQHLFLSSEIPVNEPTTISGIAFDYYHAQYQPMTNTTNCSIYLAHTNRPHMFVGDSSFVPYNQLQLVYVGPLNFPTNGWHYFEFNQGHFHYDGHSNLCLAIVDNSGTSHNAYFCFRYEQVVDDDNSAIPVTLRSVAWGSTAVPYSPVEMDAHPTSYSFSNWRSNTRFITGGAGDCTGWATCLPPVVIIDTNYEDYYRISWIPGYHESSWDVDYRVADSNRWTRVANDTTATFCFVPTSNFQPDTRYEFRVTSNCSDTTVSASAFITTPCSYIRIPFAYSFEGLPTGNSTTPADIHCWHHLNDGAIYNGSPFIVGSGHSGSRSIAFAPSVVNYHGTYNVIVLPPVDVSTDPINTLYLSFWAAASTNNDPPVLYVGVMTDPDDITSFQAVDTVNLNYSTYGWDLYEVRLNDYIGNGQYIAIRADRPSLGFWSAIIDDIRVSNAPLCPRVHDLKISNVTTDSATVSWTRGGSETAWKLTLGDSTYYPTDTFYNVHNLVSNTPYTAAVHSICSEGDTSIAVSASFITPCYLLSTLPFYNNFENEPFYQTRTTSYIDAFPSCWRRIPPNQYYPYIVNGNTSSILGNNYLYWYLNPDDNYPDNEYAVLPPVDLGEYDISDLYLQFYAKTTVDETPHPMFIVGVMPHSTDTASFIPVDTIVPTRNAALYTVSFANYSGTYNYIAIRSPRTSRTRQAMLDDIYLTDHVCNPVNNLRASSTASTVTLWWNANGHDRFTVVLNADTIRGVTDTFYTFRGLDDSIVHNYAVAAECDGDNSILLTGSIQTECPPLTYGDLPYTEDFEVYDWRGNAISPCWHKSTANNLPNPDRCDIAGDTVGLYFTASTRHNSWAALPRLDDSVDISRLEIDFMIKRYYNPSYPTQVVVGVASGIYSDSTSIPQHSDFVPIDTIDLSTESGSSIHNASIRFANYTGNGKYIIIQSAIPPDSTALNNVFYIDNVTLKVANPCPTPQHVVVTRVTDDSVYVTWDPMSDADTFLIYIGAPSFDTGSVAPQYVYGNSAAIGNLSPNSEYELVVVARCNGGESDASYPIRFHTHCAPLTTLPFTEDFEGVSGNITPSLGINNLPPCWLYWNMGTELSNSIYPIIYGNQSYAHGGTNAMCFSTGSVAGYTDQIAIMPITDATRFPVSGLQVSFWMRSHHYYYNSYIVVGVISNPDDTSTFIPVSTLYTYNSQVISSNHYSHHTVSFANYTGPHGHIAFKAPCLVASNLPYIDDITLEPHPCPIAEGLHVVHATTDSLIIAWTDTNGSSWFLEYDTADFIPHTGMAIPIYVTAQADTGVCLYTLAGLDSGTTYHIYLYPDCQNPDTFYHLTATTPATCTPPQNITGSIFADSLSLTWSPVGTETLWVVTLGNISVIVNSPDYTFRGLSRDSIYMVSIRSICGQGDTSLPTIASFTAPTYLVTVTANNPTFGSATGDGTYYYGDTATLTATPNTGYRFTEWNDGDTANPRNLIVTSDTIVVALFQRTNDSVGIDNSRLSTFNSQLRIHPNPTTGATTVSLTGISGKVCIAVLDMHGREVTRECIECPTMSSTPCEKQINITHLPAGAYILHITSESNAPIVQKLIVK